MSKSKTDIELVEMSKQNSDYFAFVIERYKIKLENYVKRLGVNKNNSQDVLQNIFIKVYINLNSYDTRLPFSSWIYRIAHNEAISYFRKEKITPQPFKNEEDMLVFDTISSDLDIEKDSLSKENKDYLLKIINSLDKGYRDIILLRYFEEKSYTEISDILKIPEGTVASNIARAKKQIRKILEGDINFINYAK